MIAPACNIKTIVSLRIQFQTGRTTHVMLTISSHVLGVIRLYPSHPIGITNVILTQFTPDRTHIISFRSVGTQLVYIIGILREINTLIRITYRIR